MFNKNIHNTSKSIKVKLKFKDYSATLTAQKNT